jgi:hypothetical protein
MAERAGIPLDAQVAITVLPGRSLSGCQFTQYPKSDEATAVPHCEASFQHTM